MHLVPNESLNQLLIYNKANGTNLTKPTPEIENILNSQHLITFLHLITSNLELIVPKLKQLELEGYPPIVPFSSSKYAIIVSSAMIKPTSNQEEYITNKTKTHGRSQVLSTIYKCIDIWCIYYLESRSSCVMQRLQWLTALMTGICRTYPPSKPFRKLLLMKINSYPEYLRVSIPCLEALKETLSPGSCVSKPCSANSLMHIQGYEFSRFYNNHLCDHQIQAARNDVNESLSVQRKFQENVEMPPQVDIYAILDEVYVQLDPVSNRLLMDVTEDERNSAMEIQCSTESGTLAMSTRQVVWRQKGNGNCRGIRLQNRAIDSIHFGIIKTTRSFFIEDRTLKQDNGKTDKRKIFPEETFEEQVELFSMDVRLKNSAFRFFPFTRIEIGHLANGISNASDIRLVSSIDLIKEILTDKVEVARCKALEILSKQPNPWIDNPHQLNEILLHLTTEHQPQKMIDMERLYHSCRLEKEVTRECILYLKKIWYNAKSELVKIKVLSVLDRILDPMIMPQSDASFDSSFKWLVHLEETMNPSTSSEVFGLICGMIGKAKNIQSQLLTPLMQNQVDALFDGWDAYSSMNFSLNASDINTPSV